MICQSFVAVVIGLSIGLIYYMMSTSEEEERAHKHGYSSSSRTSSGYSSPRRHSSSRHNEYMVECSICLSTINISDMVQLTPCLHLFHKECIMKWRTCGPASVHDCCPICRGVFGNANF